MNVNLYVFNGNILGNNEVDVFTVAKEDMKTSNPQKYWVKNFPKELFDKVEFKPYSLRGYQQIANVPNEIKLDMEGAVLTPIRRIQANGALYVEI